LKILLVVDNSPYSTMATKMLKVLRLPSQTEVTVMTVVPEYTFIGGITLGMLRATAITGDRVRKAQEKKATALIQALIDKLQPVDFKVETAIRWGKPAEQILSKAHEMQTGLIVIGAKSVSDSPRFPLGSIAQKVMKYAGCSVLLVREGPNSIRQVFLAVDGSKYSDEATRFLLDLPLPQQSQVMVLTTLQSHSNALKETPTLDLESNGKVLAELQATEEKTARSLINKTKKQFEEKGNEVSSWLLRGEPAEEILVAANELNPELIALGAKGLTGIESFLLGSVAQSVARFSRYSVLIVRPAGAQPAT
jgi:nucleotide-binding universal stress UspA family protein